MTSAHLKPKARAHDLLVRELASGEAVIYDKKTNEAHNLNRVASAVWRRCDGGASTAGIAASVSEELDIPCDEAVVHLAVKELQEVDLVEETGSSYAVSRRDLVRRVGPGLAAAALLPAVLSVVAPTPAAAATCVQSGGACSSGAQCCSGFCKSDNTCA